ncbi:MAG: DUF5615 family PIN-like protein [Candidatus Entotheonellia bacterium]
MVLRRLGHEVLTTAESGRAGQAIPDPDILAFAIVEQRIVVTLNRRRFMQLHHVVPEHTGIVVCTLLSQSVCLLLVLGQYLKRRALFRSPLGASPRSPPRWALAASSIPLSCL